MANLNSVFTPMENVIFPIFYKGLSKANLTEKHGAILICARAGKLGRGNVWVCMLVYLRSRWQT